MKHFYQSHKTNFIFFALIISLVACKKSSAPEAVTASQKSNATAYQLVWSDEFNGTSVNTNDWNFETGGGGWGNNEKEYYQSSNATEANGYLVITAKKQRVKANGYTSARMTTKAKHQFTYGKIEARISLPLVQGLWPAFWMLGANIDQVNWPTCGETDIMEHINTDNIIYGTIHWNNNGHVQYGCNTTTTPDAFHVYTVEWDSTSIKWSVDSVQYCQADISNTDAFHKPFFVILNMAVGGNWPGQTIDDKKLPASMYVDYVRVYQ